jgi:hypothetical protein
MRGFLLLLLVPALVGCSPPILSRVIHVTTYRDGQTDIVRRDLLFRGKLKNNTVRDVLSAHGMAEDVTVVTKGTR